MVRFATNIAGRFVLLLFCLSTASGLSYTDLEALEASCKPRDSCVNTTEERLFFGTNCECDAQCERYGDCCIDVTRTANRSEPVTREFTCMKYGVPFQGVYVINKCSSSWAGPREVRSRCERVNDMSDPILAAPATDVENDLTFKNTYCAVCNNANVSQLTSWNIGVKCESLEEANNTGRIPGDYIQNNLFFKRTYPYRNNWGVYYFNATLFRLVFHPCRVVFQLPGSLEEHARLCRPDVVSACSPTWRDNALRRHCQEYMAVVYVGGKAYRNPHCALCNNVNMSSLSCITGGMLGRGRPPMSFTLLLDVNQKDGNRVGHIDRCQAGWSYDPFAKKCRQLVCALPGFKMVGNKCVRGY